MLGLLLVAVGFVGIFVPLLPTTDFMLLALPCFARSSPRLEAWLLNHPRFGPSLRAWRATGAVPRHAKIAACIGMMAGYGLFWLHVQPGLGFALAVAVGMLASAIWIIRRPVPEDKA
ncbi:YbaN family protein [Aurantiacibacter xanthus]|uniref:YbaN family protein n=1 Tax=Aurantiacibacter xanthus TaxID=1784712 RepID=UPI00319DEF91